MSLLVPYKQISPLVLKNICESYIAREGTDYGMLELSMAEKVEDLIAQIAAGGVVITYDADAESINLMTKVEYWKLVGPNESE